MSKIVKEVNELNIEFCANGFVVKANGRDENDNWVDDKVICLNIEDVKTQIQKYSDIYNDK